MDLGEDPGFSHLLAPLHTHSHAFLCIPQNDSGTTIIKATYATILGVFTNYF
jgi:hypothetical protein